MTYRIFIYLRKILFWCRKYQQIDKHQFHWEILFQLSSSRKNQYLKVNDSFLNEFPTISISSITPIPIINFGLQEKLLITHFNKIATKFKQCFENACLTTKSNQGKYLCKINITQLNSHRNINNKRALCIYRNILLCWYTFEFY